jgi:Swi5-dependent recombination DNA repair protein 1
MSTPPASKRRRVDSLGIHKPFVSPLKRNTGLPTTNTTSTPAPSRTQPTPSTPYTPFRSSNLKTSTPLQLSHPPHDTEIVAAQQAIKNLEARIRVLRSQNGILSQAVQITSIPATTSSQPSSGPATSTPHSSSSQQHQQYQPRLIRLTQKWNKATQQAAEQVFVSFSQNMKDNGGYNFYLQTQRQASNNSAAFFNDNEDDARQAKDASNEEDWRDEDGDVLTERGKRQRRGEIEEKEYGYTHRQGGEDGEEEEEEEEEEDELSLGTMLQVLNIDPEVIGWDTKTLAWK